jgi:hypothetical protein
MRKEDGGGQKNKEWNPTTDKEMQMSPTEKVTFQMRLVG